jgi:hypothetical protein
MQVVQTAATPNPETIWAILQEVTESQKENSLQMKENERISKERSAKIDAQIGSLTNLFGDFTLGMVAPKLCDKFITFDLFFPRANPNVIFDDKRNNISFEVDIMLENGDKAMLIEVKTKLTEERIKKHIIRLEKMRRYANKHGDKRTFLGAVAGFAITEEVRKLALEEGFYLIEPDGENFNITSPHSKPKEW